MDAHIDARLVENRRNLVEEGVHILPKLPIVYAIVGGKLP